MQQKITHLFKVQRTCISYSKFRIGNDFKGLRFEIERLSKDDLIVNGRKRNQIESTVTLGFAATKDIDELIYRLQEAKKVMLENGNDNFYRFELDSIELNNTPSPVTT